MSSEEGDRRLEENERKMTVSMERLRESEQREKQLKAQIEELTTR
jgi:hypothetical protein